MLSETKFVRMRDNIELHTQIKEVDSPIWLIVTHGIGEHLERHSYIRDLVGRDFNILSYDLRGHGRSLGASATIFDFDQYRHDLTDLIGFLSDKYKMKRYVLFGHSMGALITAGFVQRFCDQLIKPELVYLNAPPVGFAPPLGQIVDKVSVGIFKSLANISASIRLGGMVDLSYLSHDPQVKEKYIEDPLNALTLHTRLLLQLAKDAKQTFSKPLAPPCPAFVSWGSEDRIVSVEHIKKYFSTIEKDFETHEFEGAYHEIHNEVEKYRLPYFDYLSRCLKQALTLTSFDENNHE
jgi:alpha-beta hydrolase superfamily lysophospholipase